MLKVLIADDHKIIHKGIQQILQEEFDHLVIDNAFDTTSLIEKATAKNWDIIISDISMPGAGGLVALKKIKEKIPDQRILIITNKPEEEYAAIAMQAGAHGFLNKNTVPEELNRAVRMILSGRRYLLRDIADKMTSAQLESAGFLPHDRLNDVEFGVLLGLASGFSVAEIAGKLSLSAKTISTNRVQLMNKMDIQSDASLRKYAKKYKLI